MQRRFKIVIAGTGLLLAAGTAAGVAISAQGDRAGAGQDMGMHGQSMDRQGMHKMNRDGLQVRGRHEQHRSGGFRHRGHGKGHGQGLGQGGVTKTDAQSRARQRFARFDANSDGVIDAAEIEARFAARAERRKARRGGAKRAMRWQRKLARFDTDRNGKISRAEFDARLKMRFARLDLTNDGAITDADLPPRLRDRNFLSSEAIMNPRMAQRSRGRRGHKLRKFSRLRMANTDNNGTVTSTEFFAAADNRFSRMDKNGDGVIDPTDKEARRSEKMTYRVARFIHRFGPAADASGSVTREQFQAKAGQRFAMRDADGDGVLSGMERRRGGHFGGRNMRRHRMGGHRMRGQGMRGRHGGAGWRNHRGSRQ